MKLPFGTISITEESKKLITKIIDSNKFFCGKYVRDFEEHFVAFLGVKRIAALNGRTDVDVPVLAVLTG